MKKLAGIILSIAIALSVFPAGSMAAPALTEPAPVPVNLQSDIKVDGDYELLELSANLLTDRDMDRGSFFYYCKTKENGVQWLEWEKAEGAYTSACVIFHFRNLSSAPVNFKNRMKAVIEYETGGEVKTVDCAFAQRNPGQLDCDGYEIYSEEAVDLEPNVDTMMRFLADVPYEFHEMAVDEENKDRMVAKIYIDDTEYVLDLHDSMTLYGYGNTDEETVLKSIHRIRKDAVGPEVLADMMEGSKSIFDSIGVSTEEYAAKLSMVFRTAVTKVTIDGDTATAEMTITTPDFIKIYQELDKRQDAYIEEVGKENITEADFYAAMGQLYLGILDDPDLPVNTEEMTMTFTRQDNYSWQTEQEEELTTKLRLPLVNI